MKKDKIVSHPASKRQQKRGMAFPYIFLACIISPFVTYLSWALYNQFTNWDDGHYVAGDLFIRSWNMTGLFTEEAGANWAPAHTFLRMVEYHLFGLNPAGYHVMSLLLHVGNVGMLYLVMSKLSKKVLVVATVALFFGLHPMHVESVAWISAQKDLLYTFFYLGAILAYCKYQECHATGSTKSMYWILISACFVLSCLSKGMGVTVPLTLVLIDSLQANDWSFKFIARSAYKKILFFVASLGFSVIAYEVQKSWGAVDSPLDHTVAEQMMFACYGLMAYIVNFFVPINLSAFHAYPLKDVMGAYPFVFRLSPWVAISSGLFVCITLWKMKNKELKNIFLFGFLFFIINIVMVLQIVPVGYLMFAERYTYLSYVGLLFVAAWTINYFYENGSRQLKKIITFGYVVVVAIFGIMTNAYANVWHDSITLWTNVIDVNASVPAKYIEFAYNNRGLAYMDSGKVELAITDFTTAIRLNSDYDKAYNNRGDAYLKQERFDVAAADFTAAINLDPRYPQIFSKRGFCWAHQKRLDLAIADYSAAIKLDPLAGLCRVGR